MSEEVAVVNLLTRQRIQRLRNDSPPTSLTELDLRDNGHPSNSAASIYETNTPGVPRGGGHTRDGDARFVAIEGSRGVPQPEGATRYRVFATMFRELPVSRHFL